MLTLDQKGHYGGRRWSDVDEAYRAISDLTGSVLAKLRRLHKRRHDALYATKVERVEARSDWGHYEPRGRWVKTTRGREWRIYHQFFASLGSSWVGTVEAHRTGQPHLNLVCHAPGLARELERQQKKQRDGAKRKWGKDWKRHVCRLKGDVRRHVQEAGWGPIGTAEPVRDRESIASYITKLAGKAEGAWSEVAKLTQLPTMAPQRFRRLRSGKGFLPPRRSNPDVTGALVRRRVNPGTGAVEVVGMNVCKDAKVEVEDAIARAEFELLQAERQARDGPFAVDVPHALSFADPARIRERLKFTPKHVLVPPAFCR